MAIQGKLEITQTDLQEVLAELRKAVDKLRNDANIINEKNYSGKRKSDLESLIGSIPFLLLNQDIFQKNQDIADFAKRLDIFIPTPEKKKREDMIGRVVSAIANFNKERIKELNYIISSLKTTDEKKSKNKNELKSSFFNEWDAAIKQMKR